jgi:hypothetical protein
MASRMRLQEMQLRDTLSAVQDFGAPSRKDGVSVLGAQARSFRASILFRLLGLPCGLYSVARAKKRSTSLRGINIRPQSEITLTFPQ